MTTVTIQPTASPSRPTWPVVLAVAFMAGPGLFDTYSVMAPPGRFGHNFAKIVEGAALVLLGVWMVFRGWWPRLNLPVAMATLYLGQALMMGFNTEYEEGYRFAALKIVRVAAAMYVMFACCRTRRDLEHIIVGLKAISFLAAILVAIEVMIPGWRLDQVFGSWGRGGRVKAMVQYEEVLQESFVRARGPMSHPNWLGYYYGVTLLLPLYLWSRYTSVTARVLIAATTAVEVLALIFGFVRLGVLGFGIGTLWLILRGAVRYRGLALGGIAVSIVVIWPFLPSTWISRVTDPDHWAKDKSLEIRLSQQFANLDVVNRHGGMGVGFGGYGDVFFDEATGAVAEHYRQLDFWFGEKFNRTNLGSHNVYLEIFIEQGLLGLVLFMAIYIVMFHQLLGSYARNRGDPVAHQLARTFEAILVSLAVMNGLIHTQERRIQWLVFGLVAAFISLTHAGLMQPGQAKPGAIPASERVWAKLRLVVVLLLLTLSAYLAAI